MKLYIKKDTFGRGIILWLFSEGDGIGPYLPARDPFNLESIDSLAQQRLAEFLDVADDQNWDAYGIEAAQFARAISYCLDKIQRAIPPAFDEECVFVCPQPLAHALSIRETPIPVSEWLSIFPVLSESKSTRQ